MKLEDGAFQAYREGKTIISSMGRKYNKEMGLINCRMLSNACNSEIFGEWTIKNSKKEELKAMVCNAIVQAETEGLRFQDQYGELFEFIEQLKIED